jgi:hypothetical protein
LNNETDPNTIAFLKQMADEYEAASGVKLQVETVPVNDTWTKVTTAIKAGKPYDFITFGSCRMASSSIISSRCHCTTSLHSSRLTKTSAGAPILW